MPRNNKRKHLEFPEGDTESKKTHTSLPPKQLAIITHITRQQEKWMNLPAVLNQGGRFNNFPNARAFPIFDVAELRRTWEAIKVVIEYFKNKGLNFADLRCCTDNGYLIIGDPYIFNQLIEAIRCEKLMEQDFRQGEIPVIVPSVTAALPYLPNVASERPNYMLPALPSLPQIEALFNLELNQSTPPTDLALNPFFIASAPPPAPYPKNPSALTPATLLIRGRGTSLQMLDLPRSGNPNASFEIFDARARGKRFILLNHTPPTSARPPIAEETPLSRHPNIL